MHLVLYKALVPEDGCIDMNDSSDNSDSSDMSDSGD